MKNALLFFFLIAPCLLMADRAFKINKKEYQYLDKLALTLDPKLITDKSSDWHNYTEIYSYYFGPIKDKPLKFLEIGIYKGSGVKLWENYFKNAELHFIDITFDYVQYSSKRSHYHLADQSNPDQLLQVVNTIGGKFDIIIEDGGHTMTQQIISFQTLFPYLNSGGLYIIEDLHTSYWHTYQGAIYGGYGTLENPKAGPNTAIQFLKDLIDDVNFVGARTASANHRKDLSAIGPELNIYREQILGMHFYDSLCIIIKR